jgi:hypothetical protein
MTQTLSKSESSILPFRVPFSAWSKMECFFRGFVSLLIETHKAYVEDAFSGRDLPLYRDGRKSCFVLPPGRGLEVARCADSDFTRWEVLVMKYFGL